MQEVTPEQAAAWRVRERDRFDDGTYTHLPSGWRDNRWFYADDGYSALRYPDHFAHVSIEKVSMVAFTENDQKGIRDRQTRMSPGKYLARFFSDVLTPQEIQSLATAFGARYNADVELLFANTADEFEEIYTSGPRSCMSHPPDYFDSCVHPVRVYAGHDLSLAYLKREGRVTARALCWPAKLIYGRLYGDSVRLSHSLEQVGYRNGSLSGARITRKMDNGEYIIPYLDYLAGAVDKGDHLLLSDGSHSGCSIPQDRQNGLSVARITCYECGERVDEDDAHSNDNGDNYCQDCWQDNYAYCRRTDETVPRDEIEEVRIRQMRIGSWRTEEWGEYARERHAFYCQHDDVWYSDDNDAVEVNNETWGPAAVERDAVFCEGSEEYVLARDSVTLADGTIWSQDHFDDNGVTIDGLLYDQDNVPDGDEPPVRKPSPTVVCDAQIEAPLVQTGLHLRKHEYSGTWEIWDGEERITSYISVTLAGHALENLRRSRAATNAAAQPIVAGCMVRCINPDGDGSGGFCYGEVYKVTRVYDEISRKRILVERDSQGSTTNGWGIEHFVFHSMPLPDRTGFHIRHEPERTFPYIVYHDNTVYNFYRTETAAQICLDEVTGRAPSTLPYISQPEEVAI